MNRSLRKELLREIRSSRARFLSIFVMVALGVMFLVGLRSAAPDMRATADGYFDGTRLYDVEILSTLGLTEEDIAAFGAAEGVESAVGGWSVDAMLTWGETQKTVKALSITEGIDLPTVVEGRLPAAEDECAVDRKLLNTLDVELGQTVTLEPGEEQSDALSGTEFTVTGVVESPLYISLDRGTGTLGDGSVAAFVLLPPESFCLDYYTVAVLTAGETRSLSAYSEEYQGRLDALTEELETLAEARGALRYETLRSDAQGEIDEAQAALDDARTQADREIADAQSELDSARAELDSGWAELAQAKQYDARFAAGYGDAIAEWEQTLQDGETEYESGLQELEDAKQKAEAELADGQREIDEAREQLSDLKPADVYVLDRNSNYGFVSYDQNATRMENLARVFPLIFFIVAALVSLTTMTRMVEEERTQIGSIKALGYGTGAIAGKFLAYGLLAALGGAVLGAAVGTTLIPWVIFTSYGIMYSLPSLDIRVYWGLCLAAGAAGIACTLGATLWAMLSTARQSPAVLMRPKAPQAGKRILLERIPPIWKHLSFSVKVSARNLFRYKKRFWMTVIGVAGCTGLLIAGLGLRSSIFDIIDIQYGEIYHYDVQMTVDPEEPGVTERVAEYLNGSGNVADRAAVQTKSVTFQSSGGTADGYLTVTADPEALYREIDLRDMDTKARLDIPADGVIIDVKLAELMEIGVGDPLTIDCGRRITVPVRGIVEHYVYHYAYMTAELYTALTGEAYAPNEYVLTVEDDSDEAVYDLCQGLMEISGVRGATNLPAMARSFRETIDAVDAAVMIIITSAAALALVVLYNLTNINITERIRELATIKVLGFYDGEVAMYIYRENIVLTVLGVALGQVLGKYLCTWLVRTIEMDIVMFGREAKLENYILSIVMSLGFAVLVNFMMYFRMRKIDMVQSLKSVE